MSAGSAGISISSEMNSHISWVGFWTSVRMK